MLANSWWQLEVKTPNNKAETLGTRLIEAGALGIEERPIPTEEHEEPASSKHYIEPQNEWVQEKIPTIKGDLCLLVAYFDEEYQQDLVDPVLEGLGFEGPYHWVKHRDDGWSTRWKEFFRPIEIGQNLVICPTWETYEPTEEQQILWIEPGMAFGTGQHATTRSCLVLIERYLNDTKKLFDVGCGSGILSLAALLLGVEEVVGIDIDADVIPIAEENAEKNGLLAKCDFSARAIEDVKEQYPFVVANIQAHILTPMAEELRRVVEPGGLLLLSGILDTQIDEIRETFEALELQSVETVHDEEWCSILLRA